MAKERFVNLLVEDCQKLLRAVEGPVRFLLQVDPERAKRAVFPAGDLAARARELASQLPTVSQRLAMNHLAATLERLARTPREESRQLLRRCQQDLAAVQSALRGGTVESDYHATPRLGEETFSLLSRPAQYLPGVGPRRAQLLHRLGIETVEDLLYHLPFRYEDRRRVVPIRDLRVGESAVVVGRLVNLKEVFVGRAQRRLLEGVLQDETGTLALVWFQNIPYFKRAYRVGQDYRVYGKVEGGFGFALRMAHPEMSDANDASQARILPVYEKPGAMSVVSMRTIVRRAVEEYAPFLPSVLPEQIARTLGLMDLAQAMKELHSPPDDADVEALNAYRSLAHQSVVFDELFFLQLGMQLRRRSMAMEKGPVLTRRGDLLTRFRARLPFTLTPAQERVIGEIFQDLQRGRPMHRLVQGDVGSGKTVVALFAALLAVDNGFQAAFMAPTELLAEQHFGTLARLTQDLPVRLVLLTGALPKAEKEEIRESIGAAEVDIVVGTHALIQEGVRFANLGLGVIDEQHRFGVLQRAALRRLGCKEEASPHILLMTATPIPRTLTMTVYGDLDVSRIDMLPPGRKPVVTLLRGEAQRPEVYAQAKRELDAGHQAYIVYPLVEGSEESDLRDATTMAQELARTVFRDYRVGLVHGRMKPAEKETVMRRFQAGELQLLVSTTVIEVGIDVPNATVMIVEHAERFGLSQLHQLRGRVGRGADQAYCILLAGYRRGDETEARLRALCATNDGFEIAERDWELRGPGDLLGTRQAGMPEFRVANLLRDQAFLEEAQRAASRWLEHDPELQRSESLPLRRVLRHRWAGRLELAQIG